MDHEFGEPDSKLLKRYEPYSSGRPIQGDYYPPDHTIHKLLDRVRIFEARLHFLKEHEMTEQWDAKNQEVINRLDSLINFHYSLFKDFIYQQDSKDAK